jgi:hypothetical protein
MATKYAYLATKDCAVATRSDAVATKNDAVATKGDAAATEGSATATGLFALTGKGGVSGGPGLSRFLKNFNTELAVTFT